MTNLHPINDEKLQRWALLIGVNEYPNLPLERQLHGCVNDADAIEQLLSSELFGFPAQNILKLTSPSPDPARLANRQNILRAFREHLLDNTGIQAGDIVVVYFSGHGSQIPDVHGDEEDGWDETLVPCDVGPDRDNPDHVLDISDDELSLLLDRLAARTRNINLFFDCCHSGTVTRALQEAQAVDARGRARWLPPAGCVATAQLDVKVGSGTRTMGPSDWLPLSEGYVALAACRASELAQEDSFITGIPLKVKQHGVLTYCLLQSLRAIGRETTYYDIWDEVQEQVIQRSPWQHPQIEGAFERKVFGGAALPRKRYVEVLGRTDDTVTLAAGLVHGATLGSRFAIYPPGSQTFEGNMDSTRSKPRPRDDAPDDGARFLKTGTLSASSQTFADTAARVAVVRLTTVGTFTSSALREQGDPARIITGAPAIEIEHDYGSMQMAVRVTGEGALLDAVRQEIGDSPLLALAAAEDAPATATVRLCYPLRTDGSQDTREGEKLCLLSSGDGYPLVEPLAPDESGPVATREKLEQIARYYNILAIRTVDPASNLQGKVHLRLLRVTGQDEKGQDLLAPAERNEGGDLLLKLYDRIVLEVENRSDQALHVTILDCDTQWGVQPVFPPAGAADDRVAAGQARRTIRFRVNLPDHQKPVREHLPLPRETIKVIATTQRVDFRSLWLPGTRDLDKIEGGKFSLYRLLGQALGGGAGRATRVLEEDTGPLLEDWTTKDLIFYVSG
jgi:hypothetical protein